jgi:hypothetical protein
MILVGTARIARFHRPVDAFGGLLLLALAKLSLQGSAKIDPAPGLRLVGGQRGAA